MSNKCPKCGEKLSPLYMKQNCPKCNTNLVYYDLDKRLESDHIQAMKEQEAVDRVLNNIKTSAFGGPLQIIRFILMFSPLLWMCLPMFKTADNTSVTLINVIMGIINGSLSLDAIFADKSYLFPILTMVCVILFSIPVIISTLFSIGEKAYKRIRIFQLIYGIALLVCLALNFWGGSYISYGFIIIVVTFGIVNTLHKKIDNKLNKQNYKL